VAGTDFLAVGSCNVRSNDKRVGPLRGKPYLSASIPSKPGVAGKLDSCTVSSLGAAPLAPRDGPLMLITGSSGSLATESSLTGMREAGAGDELCTTMAGIDCASGFLIWLRRELAREREPERPSEPGGGGDLRRGEMGQWGVLSPELGPDVAFKGRGALMVSAEDADDAAGSSGMLVEDSARCMAAADGELLALALARLEARLGLASVLLLRERRPGLGLEVPEGALGRWCGRAGDASREDKGDLGEGEFSERAPARVV
jgi:hypothetical protein